MARALVTAEQVHGVTGLDGPHFPDPVMPLQDMHGVDWLIETLSKAAPDFNHDVHSRPHDEPCHEPRESA